MAPKAKRAFLALMRVKVDFMLTLMDPVSNALYTAAAKLSRSPSSGPSFEAAV